MSQEILQKLQDMQERMMDLAKEYLKAKEAESKKFYLCSDDSVMNSGYRFYFIEVATQRVIRYGTITRMASLIRSRGIQLSDVCFGLNVSEDKIEELKNEITPIGSQGDLLTSS
jgi:hypothetical protein